MMSHDTSNRGMIFAAQTILLGCEGQDFDVEKRRSRLARMKLAHAETLFAVARKLMAGEDVSL